MKTSKQESPVFVPSLQREAATQAAFSLTGSPATFTGRALHLRLEHEFNLEGELDLIAKTDFPMNLYW